MKTKLVILLAALSSDIIMADGIDRKDELVTKDGKKTIVYNYKRQGALLPFKTYHEWDDNVRPCCWNGYGIDPSGVNYWTYFNEETECFSGYDSVWEGNDHCKISKMKEQKIENIPEPNPLSLFLLGLFLLACSKIFSNKA
jgi:hypothetical protein